MCKTYKLETKRHCLKVYMYTYINKGIEKFNNLIMLILCKLNWSFGIIPAKISTVDTEIYNGPRPDNLEKYKIWCLPQPGRISKIIVIL